MQGRGHGSGERAPPAFIAVSWLLFLASTAAACIECKSMSAMGTMPLPAGGSVSMMWMPMHGGTWAGTYARFMGMWLVMMTAMMLPSFAPMLWRRYLCSLPSAGIRHAALPSLGYFATWLILGSGIFAAGALLTSWQLRLPWVRTATPIAAAIAVLVGAALQCSSWKMHQLSCCREQGACTGNTLAGAGAAFRWGLRHGFHCACCCAGLNMAMLAMGAMELKVMALVTVAVSIERLAPNAKRAAHAIGLLLAVAGVCLLAQASQA